MKIGDRCFVHGYIDEIRKDTVIIRNEGGYFGTDPGEVIVVSDTAHPNWIPVSERLPETGGESFFDGMVLITLRDKETGDLYVLNDKYCGDGDWLMCVPDEPTEVIAWMPLPEPYKPNNKQSGKEGA